MAEWLTLADVSGRLHVNERTVRRWHQDGLLRAVKIGGIWRTRSDWLDEFLTARADEDELARARRYVQTLFGRSSQPGWLRVIQLATDVAIAVAVGALIEKQWRCEWHPSGLDLDSLAGIVVAVVLVLLLRRYTLERLARQVGAKAMSHIRKERPAPSTGQSSTTGRAVTVAQPRLTRMGGASPTGGVAPWPP